ncbi:MAG: hypothetical protein ACHQ50_07050 [Fimbriimonadales bacterium]
MDAMDQQDRLPAPFPPDRVIGIVIMVGSALLAVLGIVVSLFLSVVRSMMPVIGDLSAGDNANSKSGPLPMHPDPRFFAILIAVVLAIGILQFTSGLGIMRSRAWGFYAAIAASVIGLCGGVLGIVFSVALIIYTIMRLTGSVGPKPV